MNFKTQKKNQAMKEFEMQFINYSIMHSMERQWKMLEIENKENSLVELIMKKVLNNKQN